MTSVHIGVFATSMKMAGNSSFLFELRLKSFFSGFCDHMGNNAKWGFAATPACL